jgi:hypothetical protein
MNWDHFNWMAVVVAALSNFGIGGLWYSPLLFGRVWMRVNGFSDADLARHSKGRAFGGATICALIMAINLAVFLADEQTTIVWGMTAGALAGGGWVAAGLVMTGLFENRSWTYLAINGGYHLVSFVIMGAILGAWR